MRLLSSTKCNFDRVQTKYEVKNGVAVIKFDAPNSKVNVLNTETMTEMKELLDLVEKDPAVKAAVLMSGTLSLIMKLNFTVG